MYFVVCKYKSKYGLILYATKVSDDFDPSSVDFNNLYLHTLYFKGSQDVEISKTYQFQTIKGENGYTYCFL